MLSETGGEYKNKTKNRFWFIWKKLQKNTAEAKKIRLHKYANIIFTKETYENRDSIIFFLRKNNIIPIGRFGKWEYFWSDQAFLDGKKEGECFSYDE